VPIVLKSGNLYLLEPSVPVQASNGIALLFTLKITDGFVSSATRILNYCNFSLWNDRQLKILRLSSLKRICKKVNFMSHIQVHVGENGLPEAPRAIIVQNYRLQFLVILVQHFKPRTITSVTTRKLPSLECLSFLTHSV